jgi:two-component system chemotaxis response regulator CheY
MSKRVLVVDDSGTMRKIISRSLHAVGFTEVVEAADGSEGIAAFRNGGFELVITDWNMPNKTGVEMTREIRATGSKAPIVMVTTEGDKSHVLEAIQAGVSDYLVKPFTAELLRDKLVKFAVL